jgi:hypothetical protein
MLLMYTGAIIHGIILITVDHTKIGRPHLSDWYNTPIYNLKFFICPILFHHCIVLVEVNMIHTLFVQPLN